jgi:hypothetical protein
MQNSELRIRNIIRFGNIREIMGVEGRMLSRLTKLPWIEKRMLSHLTKEPWRDSDDIGMFYKMLRLNVMWQVRCV